ncbi:MAG: glycan-binding surface protein [Bacteroidales bacterium]
MKNTIYKALFFLSLTLLTTVCFFSCEEKSDNGGTPSVDYIRLTNPEKADSAITSAFMGQLIAIIGENLSGARKIWFNDREVTLTPTYVTDNSILVNVSREVPLEKTDKMTITFSSGYNLELDFVVDIPPPAPESMKCEFLPDGDTAVIYGDYFFEPLTVTFAGNREAEIISIEKTELVVSIPAGTEPGQIVFQNIFGTVSSPFLFRDNRNTIVNFDDKPHEDWTAAVISSDTSIYDPVSGNYGLIASSSASAWNWENNMAIFCWGEGVRDTEEPLAQGIVSEMDFKFEVNVQIPWYDIRMEIYFSPYGEEHGRDNVDPSFARWKPWADGAYTTDGWVTVTIPMSEFWFDKDDGNDMEEGTQPLESFTGLTNLNMMVFGPQETDESNTYPVQIFIDNIRIVPHDVE